MVKLILLENSEFLAAYRIKNKISQSLSKYKHGNDIHEQICSQLFTKIRIKKF